MWNPEVYGKFAAERRQPFVDLLAMIEHRPKMRVVDLGCGGGELTKDLHEHLGAEETLGIDNSETMLLKTSAFGAEMLRFQQGDIEAFVTDRPFDLVFSNAAFHWVPDHVQLLTRLTSFLTPEGQIAVQMPANDEHPSHRVAAEVAAEFGLRGRPDYVLRTAEYASLLHRLGYKRQNVRLQVYGHLLESTRQVVDWVKGALLTEYEKQLEPGRYAAFLERYTERLLGVLGEERPYFYTYDRVLFWGAF